MPPRVLDSIDNSSAFRCCLHYLNSPHLSPPINLSIVLLASRSPMTTMTMTMDQQHRQLGTLGYDHPYSGGQGPQFTNPWGSATQHSFGSTGAGFGSVAKQQSSRSSSVSMSYPSIAATTTASSMGAVSGYAHATYGQQDLLGLSQDIINTSRSTYDQGYAAAPASSVATYATISAPFGPYGNVPQNQQQSQTRRLSQQ